jgi:hypothetical protein
MQEVNDTEFSTYINPRTDFGFKKIFGQKELMKDFLCTMLGEQITDITYRPVE